MDFRLFLPLEKVDKEQRMVWGYASTPDKDMQGEIVDLEAVKKALPSYMEWGNIREMHQPSAVGVAKEASMDERGLYLGAKIVDDVAWNKVQEGVYKGFSIGGQKLNKVGNMITELTLVEISLVDRPANPSCRIEVFKAAGLPASKETVALPESSKSMGVVSSLAYAFDSIRDSQRSLLREADQEKDTNDTKLASMLGTIAESIAEAIAEKARHEKQETADLSDTDDRWLPQNRRTEIMSESVKTVTPEDLAKAVEDAVSKRMNPSHKNAFSKGLGHFAKGISSHEQGMACMATGFSLCEKAEGAATSTEEFKKAAAFFADAQDQHELAKASFAKAATGWIGAASPDDWGPSLGGKRTTQAEMINAAAALSGDMVSKASMQELIDTKVALAKAEGRLEALAATPAEPKAARFVYGKGAGVQPTDAKQEVMMKGVETVNMDDAESRKAAASRMIGNMICNPDVFAKSMMDPTFNGGAGQA